MERRCRRTPFPRHHHRGHHRCRHHCVHIQHPFQAEDGSQRRQADTRGETGPHDSRSLFATHRPLLVRLDLEPACLLGAAGHRRYTHRSRGTPDLFARVELHHRRLPDAREQRPRRQHPCAICGRRRIPPVRRRHVP